MTTRVAIPICLVSLALAAPASAATLFGLVSTGELYASADGGSSWSVRATLPIRDAVALAAGTTSARLTLASEKGGVYRSLDAGATWVAMTAVPASDVTALVTLGERVFLFTRSGTVYASTDGADFSAVGEIVASNVVSATRWRTSLFTLTRNGEISASCDSGRSWSSVGAIEVSDAVEIVTLGERLYALTGSGDVARAEVSGTGWTFVGSFSQTGAIALTTAGGQLVASTAEGEVATSAVGDAWTWRGAIGQMTVRALASDEPSLTAVEPTPGVRLDFDPPRPNPARSAVTFAFGVSSPAEVTLEVLDLQGRRVARPIAGQTFRDERAWREWRPRSLPAGLYFARLSAEGITRTRAFVWLGH